MDKIEAFYKSITVTELLLIMIWIWLIKIYFAIKAQTEWMKEDDTVENIGEN